MKPNSIASTLAALLVTTGALAQPSMDHSQMKGMGMSKPGAINMEIKPDTKKTDRTVEPAALTDGEVRKLDRDRGLVTLKHGEIRSLGMPGMTMVFHATDKAMLQNIKEGDKVKFAADLVNSRLAVTRIEAAP